MATLVRNGPVSTEIVDQGFVIFLHHVELEKLIQKNLTFVNIRYRSYVNNPMNTICSYEIVTLKTKLKIIHPFKIKIFLLFQRKITKNEKSTSDVLLVTDLKHIQMSSKPQIIY